jgi:hypothetical protein
MPVVRSRFRPRLESLEQRLTPADTPSLVVPVFNSLPGAPATIYLDFNGHFDATWGSNNNVDTPPFDTNSSPTTFSPQELTQIQEICRYVAEDYAPFRINVTTVLPANFNKGKALRVAIGGDGAWLGVAAGGVAFVDTFSGTGVTPTCFAFSAGFGGNTKGIADVSSHEAGHMFGLEHQSEYNASGTKLQEYYGGLSDATAPIMGNSYVVTRSMWWFGTSSAGSTTLQDDLVILSKTANAFGFRADDHGNTAAAATTVKGKVGAVSIAIPGVITNMNDSDWFKITAKPGPATFTVDVPNPFNNLDPVIELRNSSGAVVASANPPTAFDATVTFNIKVGGTYFVVVKSAGKSSASATNNYGHNIGAYTLTGQYEALGAPFRIYSPMRWSIDGGVYRGVVTIPNAPFSLQGPITLQITLPSSSIRWTGPRAVQDGRSVLVTINKDLVAGQSMRFFVKLRNPGQVNLGSFFIGLAVKI